MVATPIVTISGVGVPTPTDFQVGIMDISKAERNASGKMIIERIAVKRKLFFTYSYITQQDASKVLKLVAPTYYTVTYVDPQDNMRKSGQFYCGDRQIGYISYRDGGIIYKDLTFNLIEL
jgi:hypothetical protein